MYLCSSYPPCIDWAVQGNSVFMHSGRWPCWSFSEEGWRSGGGGGQALFSLWHPAPFCCCGDLIHGYLSRSECFGPKSVCGGFCCYLTLSPSQNAGMCSMLLPKMASILILGSVIRCACFRGIRVSVFSCSARGHSSSVRSHPWMLHSLSLACCVWAGMCQLVLWHIDKATLAWVPLQKIWKISNKAMFCIVEHLSFEGWQNKKVVT